MSEETALKVIAAFLVLLLAGAGFFLVRSGEIAAGLMFFAAAGILFRLFKSNRK